MKTTKIVLGALAALSFVGISCQREEQIVDQPTEKIHMTLIASSDDETRSILQADGTTVLWGDNEQLHVFETIDYGEGVRVTHTPSSVGVSTDGGETMSFDVSLDPFLIGSSYVYNAVYPNCDVVETDNDDPSSLKVITPSTQKATATSFDGDADLLIAKQVTKNQQPTSLQVGFKRMLVLGKMTLTNVASETNVKSVKFSSPNKKITGRSKMNLTSGEAVQYGYDSEDFVEVTYEDNISANNLTVFFTCFPFQIAAGETFTVEVTTKDNEKFTKVVTIPENRSLNFALGENTVFSVNMEGIAPETVDNLAGKQFVILARTTTNYYYMSSTLTGSGNKYYESVAPNPSVEANADIDFTNSRTNFPNVNDFWEIEKCNTNYAIKSVTTGKYISWTSGNSAAQSDDPYELIISLGSNGLYRVASKTDPDRLLEYNASNPRFAFYLNSGNDLYLIPVGPADTRTPLEEVTLSASQVGNTMDVVVSWAGVEHATGYTVALGNQSETIPLNSAQEYQHTFTVTSFGTYEVTVTANPEEGYKESVTTVSVIVADKTPMITLNKNKITNVDAEGWNAQTVTGVYTLNDYATDSDISISVDGTVVTGVALSEGSVILTVSENTNDNARSGSFTLTISGEEFTVQVNQKGSLDEPTPETFVITPSDSGLHLVGSYSSGSATINGFNFSYERLLTQNNKPIQMEASNGFLLNTTAIGQRIVSIQFSTITNSVTVEAGADATNLSVVTGDNGLYTFDADDGIKYFKITPTDRYAVIGPITVTYIPSNSGGSETKTYQHVFNAKPSTGSNIALSGVNWNISATNLGNYNSQNYAGVQIGSSKNNGSISLTSDSSWNYEGKSRITEVRLWLNLGGTSVTPSVTIGGKAATSDGTTVVKNSSAGSDWTKATMVTFTPAADGDTGVVVINVQTVLAGYICAMEIDCE